MNPRGVAHMKKITAAVERFLSTGAGWHWH